jgi:hypothetical protein
LLDSREERVAILCSYSRFQLIGLALALFSRSKNAPGELLLNTVLNKGGLARVAAEVLTAPEDQVMYFPQYLTVGEKDTYEKFRSDAVTALLSPESRVQAYAPSRRYEHRRFWSKRAYDAVRRLSIADQALEIATEQLAATFESIYYRQQRRCVYCTCELRTAKGKCWRNGSADRRIPKVRSGTYESRNVDIVCTACQSCKWWYDVDDFRNLLCVMAIAPWSVTDSLLLHRELDRKVKISPIERERVIFPWCTQRYRDIIKTENCKLTFEDIYKLVDSRWVGMGNVKDEAFIEAPLGTMSIDRIDSAGAYAPGNIRLLLWGLNSLKKNDKSDSAIIGYLRHLREQQVNINLEAIGFPRFLPLQR